MLYSMQQTEQIPVTLPRWGKVLLLAIIPIPLKTKECNEPVFRWILQTLLCHSFRIMGDDSLKLNINTAIPLLSDKAVTSYDETWNVDHRPQTIQPWQNNYWCWSAYVSHFPWHTGGGGGDKLVLTMCAPQTEYKVHYMIRTQTHTYV